jgi:hypothetical protein
MAGAMRKMAVYLGLVEGDDRYDDYDDYDERPTRRARRSAGLPGRRLTWCRELRASG